MTALLSLTQKAKGSLTVTHTFPLTTPQYHKMTVMSIVMIGRIRRKSTRKYYFNKKDTDNLIKTESVMVENNLLGEAPVPNTTIPQNDNGVNSNDRKNAGENTH